MRKGLYSVLILLLFSVLFSTSAVEPKTDFTTDNVTSQFRPIKFWRSPISDFNITDSHVFPMVSISRDNSFENLGKAWITWTLESNGNKFAVFSIYDRGKYRNFTVVGGQYSEINWFGVQDQLIIVASTAFRTTILRYTLDNLEPLSFSLNANSTDVELFVTQNQVIGFAEFDGNETDYIFLQGIQITRSPTAEVMEDAEPSMAIIRKTNNSLVIKHFNTNTTIPNHVRGDLQIGHFLLNPVVFNFDTGIGWGPTVGNITLPENSQELMFYGLRSSIIKDQAGRLWEYTGDNWIIIADFDYPVGSFSIIDIGLYLGTTINENGLNFLTTGFDEDNDFLPDTMEDYYGSLPTVTDTDGDGVSDFTEVALGTNPAVSDMEFDYDNDGATNGQELEHDLDPLLADTDFGGALDGWELRYGFNASDPADDLDDNDGDGVTNAVESQWNTDPFDTDTDDDGMPDGYEIKFQLDPTDPSDVDEDPDNDGRNNYEEFLRGSDPLFADPRPLFDGIWIYIIMIMPLALVGSYYTMERLIKNSNIK